MLFDERIDGKPGRAGSWMYAPHGHRGSEIAHLLGKLDGKLTAACGELATELSWWRAREPLDRHDNCPDCVIALQLDRDKDSPMIRAARELTSPVISRKKKKRRAR
jgi:hypothetical protein